MVVWGIVCIFVENIGMKGDYKVELSLAHHEAPGKKNMETGEFTLLNQKRFYKKDPNKVIFEPDLQFRKDFTDGWKYLMKVLNPEEFRAAYAMALLAKANTNSLEPLNDDTTYVELAKTLNVGKNRIKVVVQKLFEEGVFGKFEIVNRDKNYKRFWVFNPYLSFTGKYIESQVPDLFMDTTIARLSSKVK